MVGWHHLLNGHEFEQAAGDGKGQGTLVCCSPWGHKESDTTEKLNNNVGPSKTDRILTKPDPLEEEQQTTPVYLL